MAGFFDWLMSCFTGKTSASVKNDDSNKTKKIDDAKTSEDGDVRFPELSIGFDFDGEWNDMSQPIRCTFQEFHKEDYEAKHLGEELPPTIHDGTSSISRSMSVELRGITLRQLRALFALVKRMCKEGTMMSTFPGKPPSPIKDPNMVTLYDINANIIMPFTLPVKKSFVETLPSTAGTQPPRWFMSHFWVRRSTLVSLFITIKNTNI